MQRSILATALLVTAVRLAAAPSPADLFKVQRLNQLGIEELKAEKYESAIERFREVEKILPDDPTAPYNIACGFSLMGKKDEAITYLKKSVALGFSDLTLFKTDPDLANIREEPGYKEALEELKKNLEKLEKELRTKARSEMRAALEKEDPLFSFGFEVTDTEGKKLTLNDLAGKVVLVDIWGTWCGPCRRSIPHLIELAEKYRKQGLEIVGLAFERGSPEERLEKVQAYAKEAGINYRCALIERTFLNQIPDFRGFPTLLIVDREGKVRFVQVGYSPYGTLAGWVETCLGADAERDEKKPDEKKPDEKKPDEKKPKQKWF